MSRYLTLVTGGARSGKSSWAEARFAAEPIRYVATGYPESEDAEWTARLSAHRTRRPAHWETLESLDLSRILHEQDPRPVLIDCLSLWLTRMMDAAGVWQHGGDVAADIEELLLALRGTHTEVLLVTNEVGSGIVPDSPGTRLFRDELGRLNSAVAGMCDEVVLTVAGIAVPIKGNPPPWRLENP